MLLSAATRLTAFVLAIIGTPLYAQQDSASWPPRNVRLVVPFQAGSTPDMVGRLVADSLQARHPGTTVIVENKPGASGNTGTDAVAKAPADGSVIGISLGGPLATNTLLFTKLPYDPERDIAPVTLLTQLPNVLAVPSSLGVRGVADFLVRLKAGGSFAYASIGAGSLSQLCMEAIAQRAGASMVHVPYPGSPAAVTALIRGDVQVACLPAVSVTSQLSSGALTILAVTTTERSPFLPDVPTLIESGIDVQSDAWNALIAPGGIPPAIIDRINVEVRLVLSEPAVADKLKAQLMTPAPTTPEALRKKIADEKITWTNVIRAAKIRAD